MNDWRHLKTAEWQEFKLSNTDQLSMKKIQMIQVLFKVFSVAPTNQLVDQSLFQASGTTEKGCRSQEYCIQRFPK